MAWLSGLAGKAEEVLNNIDKTTAAVLKKDDGKKESLENRLMEVRSLPSNSNLTVEEFLRDEARYSNSKSDLEANFCISSRVALSAPTTPACGDMSLNLQSESLAWLDKAAQNSNVRDELIDIPSNNQYNNSEINGSNEADEESQSEAESVKLNGEAEYTKILPLKKESEKSASEREQQLRLEYQKEIDALREKINSYNCERTRFIREISDITSTLEKTRFELNSVESELEQHRARALKTLQERDKLIADLRNNTNNEIDDTSVLVELNQLRQERETLIEENRQIREKLRLARQESVDVELNCEKVRQRAMEASIQAREAVAAERRRRLEVEEDARLKSEEVQSLREELSLQQSTATAKLKKQECEISRLRSRLSAAATPNSEVEMRLSTLTRTLVMKQQELERLTTDRNAQRLQLEKLEHEYQKWRKSLPFNSINDTDDAKALLPSFLIESPFDTGVTKRVKRVYSSLDAVGVRIGVFLRRYPLARIFVVIYITLLQFWVLIVLFSQSPDAR